MSLFGDVVEIINDIADNVLGVEMDVIHKAITGQDGRGKPTYATPVTRRALVIQQRKQVYAGEGKSVWTRAYVGFLFTVPDTAAVAPFVRNNPIDPNDIITLPDGTTGPIVLSGGLLDGETQKTLYNEVYLGEASASE